MNQDEQFVREKWEEVREQVQACVHEAPVNQHGFVFVRCGEDEEMIGSGTYRERWAAAAEFTRNRLEQIRQVEEEIEEIRGPLCRDQACVRCVIHTRILAREQAALADLRRGMKEKK